MHFGQGEQFRPEFLKVAPNNRIPAIVDHEPQGGGEPIAPFESGAPFPPLPRRLRAMRRRTRGEAAATRRHVQQPPRHG